MNIIVAVLIAALVGFIVYLIMKAVPPLSKYAEAGGVIAFLLVVLERLGAL